MGGAIAPPPPTFVPLLCVGTRKNTVKHCTTLSLTDIITSILQTPNNSTLARDESAGRTTPVTDLRDDSILNPPSPTTQKWYRVAKKGKIVPLQQEKFSIPINNRFDAPNDTLNDIKSGSENFFTTEYNNISFVDDMILNAPQDYSLAHCVSRDLHCGAGFAMCIKSIYCGQSGLEILKSQKHNVGEVAALPIEPKRFILNLVTKDLYYNKPTLISDIELSLWSLKRFCIVYGVNKIAMPLIACGLDKQKLSDVQKLIAKIFGHSIVNIKIYTGKEMNLEWPLPGENIYSPIRRKPSPRRNNGKKCDRLKTPKASFLTSTPTASPNLTDPTSPLVSNNSVSPALINLIVLSSSSFTNITVFDTSLAPVDETDDGDEVAAPNDKTGDVAPESDEATIPADEVNEVVPDGDEAADPNDRTGDVAREADEAAILADVEDDVVPDGDEAADEADDNVGEASATTGDTRRLSPALAAPHGVESPQLCVSPEVQASGVTRIAFSVAFPRRGCKAGPDLGTVRAEVFRRNSISKCTRGMINCGYCCRDEQILVEEGFAHELRRSSKKSPAAGRQLKANPTGSLRSNKTLTKQGLKKTCQQCEALKNAQQTVNKNGRQSECLKKTLTCQKCTNLKNIPTQKQSLDKNSNIRPSQRSKKGHAESLRRKKNMSGQQIQATQNTAQKSKTIIGPQPQNGISIGQRSQKAKNLPTENRPPTRNETSLGPQKNLTRPQTQASNGSATRYQPPKKSVNGQKPRNSLGGPKTQNLINGTRRQTQLPSKNSTQAQILNNVSTVQQPQKESLLGKLFQSARKMVTEEQAPNSVRQQSPQATTGQQPPPRTARQQATTSTTGQQPPPRTARQQATTSVRQQSPQATTGQQPPPRTARQQATTSVRQQSLQTTTGQQPPPRTARQQATTPKKPTTRPPPNRTEKKTAAGRTFNSQRKMTAQQRTQPRMKNSTGRTQATEKIDEKLKKNENGYNSTDDLANDQNEVSEIEEEEEFDEEGDLEDENGNEENGYEEEPEEGEPDEYDNEGFIEDEENSDLQEEESETYKLSEICEK
ncbi:hypothetical protein B566_EDAN016351 [Ephemera danica]|nr:hypothetical protein B566_EDAN016351 [Ephemera danica]